jgi:uncharacterized damage-inducible protein DinB
MAEIYKWVERRFDFNLTPQMFLTSIERLRGTPARVEEVAGSLTREALTWKSSPAVWSVQENIGHLLSLEPLWSTRLNQLVNSSEVLLAWEETNSSTWGAEYNSQAIRDILARFRESRSRLVQELEQVDDATIERTALHPRLKKPMRTLDLVYFVAEHDDYHLAQIARLRREFVRGV